MHLYSFQLLNHHIMVDPVYGMEVLNHMWATEPVGTTSILLTSAGLLITLSFKLLDFGWEIYKEKARQGRLKVELQVKPSAKAGQDALEIILSNTGREPVVIREVGYLKPRWLFGKHFIPFHGNHSKLPHGLNALEILPIQLAFSEMTETELALLLNKFRVKDSLGKLWEPADSELRKVRRQLQRLSTSSLATPPSAEAAPQVVNESTMASFNA